MATVTPAPVEYCHACGHVEHRVARGGLGDVGVGDHDRVLHASLWRISSVGPGGSAGGNAAGSITGGAIAIAVGAAITWAASNAAAPNGARDGFGAHQ